MCENAGMPKFVHALLPGYLSRVMSHAFRDWRPRAWSVILTILALTIATFLQPPPRGAIAHDWSKWKATAEAWVIVVVMLFVVKLACAQWKVHKEDQARIEELKHSAELLRRSDITIHKAVFSGREGSMQVEPILECGVMRLNGLVITASSDVLKCDPTPRDDHKLLTVTYSFRGQGPYTATRYQDCPYQLVLPQDQWLLEQIHQLKDAVQMVRASFGKLEQAGKLENTNYGIDRLHAMFNGLRNKLEPAYPRPLNHEALADKSNDQIAVLQKLYDELWQQTTSATSGLPFECKFRSIRYPQEEGWKEILDLLNENSKQLKYHAAKLRSEAAAIVAISAIDHT